MTLQSQLAAQPAAEEEKQVDARAKATPVYWQLVQRSDAPQSGDLARISDVLAVLGKVRADFDGDAKLVRDLAKAEAHAGQAADLRKAAGEAEAAFNEAHEALPGEIKALQGHVAELKRTRDEAGSRYSAARSAANVVTTLTMELAARKTA